MKMSKAMEIIEPKITTGFRVSFEVVEGCMLRSDYFPDHNELLIPTEAEAWNLVERFAINTRGRYVNIYVVDSDYKPVKGYDKKMIKNR